MGRDCYVTKEQQYLNDGGRFSLLPESKFFSCSHCP